MNNINVTVRIDPTTLLFPERSWSTAPKHSESGRRIILCFDGTGNQFCETNSNVLEFFRCLRKDDDQQIVYYQTGIGTYTHPWLMTKFVVNLSMKLDAAIAWNLEHHVHDAYRFLMQNYKRGDKISLFGFSRGAYTARVLAGFVQKVGLLPCDNHAQIPFAWEVFKKSDCDDGLRQCSTYKRSFSTSVKIDFIGLWDTVAALGISGRELPFAKRMRKSGIRVFRHALALDERRAKFTPNFKLIPDNHKDSPNFDPSEDIPEDDVREVWFAGCHCDVGGGSVSNDTRNSLARISLRWMIVECFVNKTGIEFDKEMLADIGILQCKGTGGRYSKPPKPVESTRQLWTTIRSLSQWMQKVVEYLLIIIFFPAWYMYYVFKSASLIRRRAHSDFETRPVTADTAQEMSDEPLRPVGPCQLVCGETADKIDAHAPLYDQLSLVWWWWIFESLPLVFRVQSLNREKQNRRINWGRGREIYGDAWNTDPRTGHRYIEVHQSVQARMEKGSYRPRAWFCVGDNGKFDWDAAVTEASSEEHLITEMGCKAYIKWVYTDTGTVAESESNSLTRPQSLVEGTHAYTSTSTMTMTTTDVSYDSQ